MTLLVSFLDGDANPGRPAPERHAVLFDGLAELVSEEAAVFWDRDVAVGGGSVGDEQLRVVRRFGTWRAFKSQPEDPNAFVAEWDAHAMRWWVGPEQHSGKNAVEHVVEYPPGVEPPVGRRAPNGVILACRRDVEATIVSYVEERQDETGAWVACPPELAPFVTTRKVTLQTRYRLDQTGGRVATFVHQDWWTFRTADAVEIRLGAYANLVQEQPTTFAVSRAALYENVTIGHDPGEAEYSRAVEAEFPPDDDY